MTRDEAIKILKELAGYEKTMDLIQNYSVSVQDALYMAIKALEQEPCDDCISRQAVLDKLNRLIEVERLQGTDEMGYGRERVRAYESMIFEIESEYLYPPVNPQPKENIKGFCVEIAGNLTNGDVIKTIFPNIDDCFSNVIDLNLWWKSTYKGVKE